MTRDLQVGRPSTRRGDLNTGEGLGADQLELMAHARQPMDQAQSAGVQKRQIQLDQADALSDSSVSEGKAAGTLAKPFTQFPTGFSWRNWLLMVWMEFAE